MKSTNSYANMSWFVAHSSLIEVETEQIKRIPHSMRFILDAVALRLTQNHLPHAEAATTNKARNKTAILLIQLMFHNCFIIASSYGRAL